MSDDSSSNKPIKRTEELLQKSEEKYRLLVEGVSDYAIFMLSPEGNIETWNKGAERLKGYKDKEIIGKHFSTFYTKEDKERKYPDYELEQAKKIGKYEDWGYRVRKDGSLFYAHVVITAIHNAEGELLGFSKITQDLTEKKEAEEKLRKSEERYRLLVEGVKDYAIFMMSPEGYLESWNEGAKRLKGYSEKEIIGKHFSIFYPKEAQESAYPDFELKQAIKLGRFEDEGLRVKKDGSTFYANVIITPIYVNEKLVGFSKITRDLTERKQAEEKLSSMNVQLENRVNERTKELSDTVAQLKRINSDLDNFIYTASHDLKAPVSNIEGLVNALNETLLKPDYTIEEIMDMLEMIKDSVLRFQTTIKDLTEINESKHKDKEDIADINLSVMIEDVLASINHLITESNAEIKIDTSHLNTFKFSKIHIRSIVYNLLTNAIKYRSPARPLEISVKSYKENNFNIIEVTDNGLGIKEENKEKIFQMFKRLHDHVEGSGIGLYLLKRILDNAGGRVEVISHPEQGTTFKIFFPSLN